MYLSIFLYIYLSIYLYNYLYCQLFEFSIPNLQPLPRIVAMIRNEDNVSEDSLSSGSDDELDAVVALLGGQPTPGGLLLHVIEIDTMLLCDCFCPFHAIEILPLHVFMTRRLSSLLAICLKGGHMADLAILIRGSLNNDQLYNHVILEGPIDPDHITTEMLLRNEKLISCLVASLHGACHKIPELYDALKDLDTDVKFKFSGGCKLSKSWAKKVAKQITRLEAAYLRKAVRQSNAQLKPPARLAKSNASVDIVQTDEVEIVEMDESGSCMDEDDANAADVVFPKFPQLPKAFLKPGVKRVLKAHDTVVSISDDGKDVDDDSEPQPSNAGDQPGSSFKPAAPESQPSNDVDNNGNGAGNQPGSIADGSFKPAAPESQPSNALDDKGNGAGGSGKPSTPDFVKLAMAAADAATLVNPKKQGCQHLEDEDLEADASTQAKAKRKLGKAALMKRPTAKPNKRKTLKPESAQPFKKKPAAAEPAHTGKKNQWTFDDLPDEVQSELERFDTGSKVFKFSGLYKVAVNFNKKSFWIYGNDKVDGLLKRNVPWAANNGPVPAWDVLKQRLNDLPVRRGNI